jgi:hypothetical protein
LKARLWQKQKEISKMDGEPGAIRTPDPQIRSLTYSYEFAIFFCQPGPFGGEQDQWVTGMLQTRKSRLLDQSG